MAEQQVLKDRRALVTGGNSGIGAAIARALGDAGARVMVNYVSNPAAAEKLVAELKANGSDAASFEADVSDRAAVARMFAALDERWGGVDILVNNAGIEGERQMTWDRDPDEWRKVLDVNLSGSFLCSREAAKRMAAQKQGVIISITSVHEGIPWAGYSAYNASKAGLSMLVKTMAQELGPLGVRVVSLAPGAIRTAINREVWGTAEGQEDLQEKIPVRRLGTPEEVARVAVFLASDDASYMTGATVFVDGGMMQYPAFMHGG